MSTEKKKKRKTPSVWDRLATAYKKHKGLRLSACDVDTLMLMDTAMRDAVLQTHSDHEH